LRARRRGRVQRRRRGEQEIGEKRKKAIRARWTDGQHACSAGKRIRNSLTEDPFPTQGTLYWPSNCRQPTGGALLGDGRSKQDEFFMPLPPPSRPCVVDGAECMRTKYVGCRKARDEHDTSSKWQGRSTANRSRRGSGPPPNITIGVIVLVGSSSDPSANSH